MLQSKEKHEVSNFLFISPLDISHLFSIDSSKNSSKKKKMINSCSFFSSQAYPATKPKQSHRSYLLCQLSAVSCKRDLSNHDYNKEQFEFDQAFQLCLTLQKPLLDCLNQSIVKRTKTVLK